MTVRLNLGADTIHEFIKSLIYHGVTEETILCSKIFSPCLCASVVDFDFL
jgi:hypothetical protein